MTTGTSENTNGLLRQHFPKRTDFSRRDNREIEAVADAIDERPRKRLAWETPAEQIEEELRSLERAVIDQINEGC